MASKYIGGIVTATPFQQHETKSSEIESSTVTRHGNNRRIWAKDVLWYPA